MVAQPLASDEMSADAALRALLADVLGLPADRVATFDRDTEMFGALPERCRNSIPWLSRIF
jgi:hypothetical protein